MNQDSYPMKVDFSKNPDGLVPVIVQDFQTEKVLMLGYMDAAALQKTLVTQRVTFYSRTKKRLWTKGEDSGHFLELVDIKVDCDRDTLLARVHPVGPVCHTGTDTCWGEDNNQEFGFITELEQVIAHRKTSADQKKLGETGESYVSLLFMKGINKIAQKVGEEAVEVVIEAKDNDNDLFLNESADLLFHYLILLQAKGFRLNDVVEVLRDRQK